MNYILLISLFVFLFSIILIKLNFSYLPGDIFVARFIQKIIPNYFEFAKNISNFATFPWYFILLGISLFFTWLIIKNNKNILISFLSFISVVAIDKILKFFILNPRPSSKLIHISQKFSGSSFPSTAALIYGSTFGFLIILILMNSNYIKPLNLIILAISTLILTSIFFARIILGAHWPSDIIFSYLISFILILTIMQFIKV